MRAPRPLAAVLAASALGLVACSTGTGPPPSVSEQTLRAIEADQGFTWTPQEGPLELGVTHTQNSLDGSDPDEARERGMRILSDNAAIWQNHHIMGFGTDNPEPERGAYNWDTLDQRMELTEDTGGRAMLTLCCAPDWMKGGDEGKTDWDELEEAPLPEHYDDFAKLAAEAVRRYPQVERVQVWNEMKGFWSNEKNRWDYEAYTDLYNRVYTAVKEVRPDVQVGGPYVVLISLDPGVEDGSSTVTGPWGVADQRTLDVVDYWLKHNVGADFIVVDASTNTRQETAPSVPDGTQKYADLDRWLKERTDLPIWWAEFYPDPPKGEELGPESQPHAVATLAALGAFAQSGASGALLWGPQGHDLESAALWTDATREDGGQPTPLTTAWQWLVPRLAEGDVEIGRSPTHPVLVFRAPDGALVVNMTGDPVRITPDTEPVAPWAITVTSRAS